MVAKYGLKIRPSDPSPSCFISGCTVINGYKEEIIMNVLENHLPVIAVLDTPVELYFYKKDDILGLHGPDLSPDVLAPLKNENHDDELGHYALFVSSGTNSKGENCWVAQNYWAKDANDGGYFNVGRPSSIPRYGRNPTLKLCFPYLS